MSDKSASLQYLLIFICTTINLLHLYYVNIMSYETLEKKKDTVITKKDKRNGVLILDENFKMTLFKK